MTDDSFIVFEQLIDAPADLIFRAFTSAAGFREWLCDVSTTNPTRAGGSILPGITVILLAGSSPS
jgi:uncharacterized protein YndB with AHSA1/START domain